MSDETPLIAQYHTLKEENPGKILLFRLGDFYEMFDEDAVLVSKLLNLTLTHRCDHKMCGIPFHASKVYIARLLRLGKKIAIAEQIGEVSKGKGLVERKVIECITPGTAVESEYLDGDINNYLASICISHGNAGFAYIDVTTGDFRATSFSEDSFLENMAKELGRCNPKELLLPNSLQDNKFVNQLLVDRDISISWYPDWNFDLKLNYARLVKQFKTTNLSSFSLNENSPEVPPAGFLLDYLEKTTNTAFPHVTGISVYKDCQYVILDDSSRRNLEILCNVRDGSYEFSLLETLYYTKTAMGLRLLRNYLSFPLTDVSKIAERQTKVEFFVNDRHLFRTVAEKLDGILDIERISSRIAMDRAHAKDLKALQQSLSLWLEAKKMLLQYDFSFLDSSEALKIIELIQNSICDDPATAFNEGRIIRAGWSEELDHWRDVHDNFNKILDDYCEEEKAKTGINNLRIRNNANQGYYIEVTKGKLSSVPSHFIMKRALLNAERYTTEKLKELEESLNESSVKILQLEHDLYIDVRNKLKKFISYLKQVSFEIAGIDVASSFAEAAVRNNWVKPIVDDSLEFNVRDGRHPVVEAHIPSGEFVPNDLALLTDSDKTSFTLITGPNMAGKSTFLRQNALIALLAQTGSFVPCSYAHIGVVDRIFCRVGASDNLAKGESTFLVEMTETARILRSATDRSLVIMDEVGRGTSTEDGLSIAWAISEYLLNAIRCKTLFATHYHELTRMEHPLMKKQCMAVNESGEDVVFLRKVVSGSSENSYGIHVARLAGIPDSVIVRANDILSSIQNGVEKTVIPEKKEPSFSSGSLFSDEELILNEILSADIDNLTPIKALQLVSRWKSTLSGNSG